MRPAAGFVLYAFLALMVTLYLIFVAAPAHGTTNIFVYVGICSIAGSITVMSVKVRPGGWLAAAVHHGCNSAAVCVPLVDPKGATAGAGHCSEAELLREQPVCFSGDVLLYSGETPWTASSSGCFSAVAEGCLPPSPACFCQPLP